MRKISYVEIILIASFLFMLFGLLYSWNKNSTLNERSKEIAKTEAEVNQILNFKSTWEKKDINRRVERLKNILKSEQIKEFRVSHKKAYIKLSNVQIKTLNRFLVKLSSLPVRFITLDVDSNGEKYDMECRCKW
jgi:murein L,D-transpeptidase YafK